MGETLDPNQSMAQALDPNTPWLPGNSGTGGEYLNTGSPQPVPYRGQPQTGSDTGGGTPAPPDGGQPGVDYGYTSPYSGFGGNIATQPQFPGMSVSYSPPSLGGIGSDAFGSNGGAPQQSGFTVNGRAIPQAGLSSLGNSRNLYQALMPALAAYVANTGLTNTTRGLANASHGYAPPIPDTYAGSGQHGSPWPTSIDWDPWHRPYPMMPGQATT